ncbi:type I DNA topoisomerase [bacterium]|nr:type I DNA topoisomerase [bacterium]
MTALVIVESPAKAKTISRFLGKDYKVTASYGHIRDLPEKADDIPADIKKKKWARYGVNLEENFEPIYVIPSSKQKYVERLKKAMQGAEELLLATDEDREGESISWHLLQVLAPDIPVKRIVFHEITPEAIQAALANPRDVDENLVRAQESRRILDRLFGYSLSPVLWKKVQSGLSAGRVQSVAVRLIVEREEERRAFKTSEYWDLEAAFRSSQGEFKATMAKLAEKRLASGKDFDATTGELKNRNVVLLGQDDAEDIAGQVAENVPWIVTRVEEKPATQRPSPPFTTSTLQQEANRKLGFQASRTMKTAQRLYEGVDLGSGERIGLITYMRTDSVTLSNRALEEAQVEINRMYGGEYAQGARPYKTKTRNAQEAHEAIRPTQLSRRPQDVADSLTRDELRLYELIWKRTVASQMPDAKLKRTIVDITAKDGQGRDVIFTASGRKIVFPGFLRAYVEGSDDPAEELGDKESLLPHLEQGQEVHREQKNGVDCALTDVAPKKHETTPPARYTEASLVKKLEEEGVGRPSTYASIISTIQDRGYVYSPPRSNQLVPTFTALAVTDLLRRHFPGYVDLKFTARMEEELDEIATGRREMVEHVREFYRGEETNGNPGLENLIAREEPKIDFPQYKLGEDPKTGMPIAVRIGRYGPFLMRGEGGDGNVADVPRQIPPADLTVEKAAELIEKKAAGPRELGEDPKTNKTVYAARGRFGAYVQLGETAKGKGAEKPLRASVPRGEDEESITLEHALELLYKKEEGNRELGQDQETGMTIYLAEGRYGPYVQLGEGSGKAKPKRASLPKDMSPEDVTMEIAQRLLSLPRVLGKDPESGADIMANVGRFGPYVQKGRDFRSLEDSDDVYTVGLDRALELLAQPKKGGRKKATGGAKSKAKRAPLRALGKSDDGREIGVFTGRYGPYVSDGKLNASLPKSMTEQDVTLEQALELLEKKAKK